MDRRQLREYCGLSAHIRSLDRFGEQFNGQ
jgi:hypothetical protein